MAAALRSMAAGRPKQWISDLSICPRRKEYSYVSHDKAATDGWSVGSTCCWQR